MKCKEIEQLIVEFSGGILDSKLSETVSLHIEHCARCSHLKEDVESLRQLLQRRTEPNLPVDLDKKTYQKCRNEMQTLQKDSKRQNFKTHLQTIPIYMKVVIIFILTVMGIWFFSLFENFGVGGGNTLTLPTYIGLFLIIQNAMMLIFSPLLIRRFRSKKINTQFGQ